MLNDVLALVEFNSEVLIDVDILSKSMSSIDPLLGTVTISLSEALNDVDALVDSNLMCLVTLTHLLILTDVLT